MNSKKVHRFSGLVRLARSATQLARNQKRSQALNMGMAKLVALSLLVCEANAFQNLGARVNELEAQAEVMKGLVQADGRAHGQAIDQALFPSVATLPGRAAVKGSADQETRPSPKPSPVVLTQRQPKGPCGSRLRGA